MRGLLGSEGGYVRNVTVPRSGFVEEVVTIKEKVHHFFIVLSSDLVIIALFRALCWAGSSPAKTTTLPSVAFAAAKDSRMKLKSSMLTNA